MQNKYMNLSAPAPQTGAPQMNVNQFAQANMTTYAQWGAKAAPPAPVKKSGLKDKVKKNLIPITIAGVIGYKVYKDNKSTPAPTV